MCSCLVDFDGNLWSFGLNNYFDDLSDLKNRNIPTKYPDIESVTQIASGCCGNHILIQNRDNKIFVGGNNHFGQLGTGETLTTNPIFKEMNSHYFAIGGNTQAKGNKKCQEMKILLLLVSQKNVITLIKN